RLRMRQPRRFLVPGLAACALLLAILAGGWWAISASLAPEERLIGLHMPATPPVPFDLPGNKVVLPGAPVGPSGSTGIRSGLRTQKKAAQVPAALLSQWRSPTDFLMHTLDDRMLKTIPRFGDSIIPTTTIQPKSN